MEGVQKWKKDYLTMMDSKMNIAMLALLLNNRARDSDFTIQRTE